MERPVTFADLLTPELLDRTNWRRRLDLHGVWRFNSADGTFADVVSVARDTALVDLDYMTAEWGYGVLLNDTRTPKEVISAILPAFSDALVSIFKATPLDRQSQVDLAVFSSNYEKAKNSGRFTDEEKAHIDRVNFVLIRNWLAKHKGEAEADYTPTPPPPPRSEEDMKNGYYYDRNTESYRRWNGEG